MKSVDWSKAKEIQSNMTITSNEMFKYNAGNPYDSHKRVLKKSEQSRVHRTIKIDTSLNTDATEM